MIHNMQHCEKWMHLDKHYKIIHADGAVAHDLYANGSAALWGKHRRKLSEHSRVNCQGSEEKVAD